MIYFDCDYSNGMHPAILKRLTETNEEYAGTYGLDKYSESAKARIREACGDPDADIFFLIGGTQANAVTLDAMLKPWQGVVCAPTGHINTYEAGAVEFTGHKIIVLPSHVDGKIRPDELHILLKAAAEADNKEHMVIPAIVYITIPTEYGTIYSSQEIKVIHEVCKQHNCKLFVDGARLGYALGADGNDITLKFLAEHCDAFYIGGTKVGAIFGEAVVFPRGSAPEHFFAFIKQHGILYAKGRFTGLQFDTLFTDGLYEKIGRHADVLAKQLVNLFVKYGIGEPVVESPTNQQFIILSHDVMEKISEKVVFEKWGTYDAGHKICRFVTSWSTTQQDIDNLEKVLADIA